jgi:hypothetical protein
VVDLEEQFRVIFARLAFCSSSLAPLPENCSFTVCIELKDEVGLIRRSGIRSLDSGAAEFAACG